MRDPFGTAASDPERAGLQRFSESSPPVPRPSGRIALGRGTGGLDSEKRCKPARSESLAAVPKGSLMGVKYQSSRDRSSSASISASPSPASASASASRRTRVSAVRPKHAYPATVTTPMDSAWARPAGSRHGCRASERPLSGSAQRSQHRRGTYAAVTPEQRRPSWPTRTDPPSPPRRRARAPTPIQRRTRSRKADERWTETAWA